MANKTQFKAVAYTEDEPHFHEKDFDTLQEATDWAEENTDVGYMYFIHISSFKE